LHAFVTDDDQLDILLLGELDDLLSYIGGEELGPRFQPLDSTRSGGLAPGTSRVPG
jgi:hypothetical protein